MKSDEEQTKRRSFEAALEGIRKSQCDYATDGVMDILREKIADKTANLKSLTPEEESKLLALTSQQKGVVANMDRTAKSSYLGHTPSVHSPSLKSHPKFKSFTDLLAGMK